MSLETHNPNQQKTESISSQQEKKFNQLQTEIVGRLKPNQSTIVATSDKEDPGGGYYLSLNKKGQ